MFPLLSVADVTDCMSRHRDVFLTRCWRQRRNLSRSEVVAPDVELAETASLSHDERVEGVDHESSAIGNVRSLVEKIGGPREGRAGL